MSPENILLYLPPEQEAAVVALFDELEARGLPRQHQRPHITVTFSPAMHPDAVRLAAELLPPLLPATFHRVGTVIFGTRSKQTIAWLLETTPELEEAARQISAANPDGRGARWTPHLTVGLRIPRAQVPEYLAQLDDALVARAPLTSPQNLKELTATRAAYWRPAQRELVWLAGEATSQSRP